MNYDTSYIVTKICCTIWNIFIVTGTVYMVGWKGWTYWWFVVPFLLFRQTYYDNKEEEDE